jgi:hypothetical protein
MGFTTAPSLPRDVWATLSPKGQAAAADLTMKASYGLQSHFLVDLSFASVNINIKYIERRAWYIENESMAHG